MSTAPRITRIWEIKKVDFEGKVKHKGNHNLRSNIILQCFDATIASNQTSLCTMADIVHVYCIKTHCICTQIQ